MRPSRQRESVSGHLTFASLRVGGTMAGASCGEWSGVSRVEVIGSQCDGKSEDYGQGRSRRDSEHGVRRRSVPDAVGAGGFGGRPPVTVGAGEAVYRMGGPPCSGMGLRWSNGELNAAMDGRVAAVLFDDGGKADIEEILAGLAETEFEQAGLRRVLQDPDHVEDWRVGEAIAEVYLTDIARAPFPGRTGATRERAVPACRARTWWGSGSTGTGTASRSAR